MEHITHKDLDALGDRLETRMTDLFKAHLKALPCASHDERMTGLAAATREAQSKANTAET